MELIIAEKPSVGRTIAAVLGVTETKNGYMQGKGMIVTWCIGHLVELAMPEEYNKDYAHWRQKDLPIIPGQWKYTVSKDSAKQYHIVTALMNDDQVHGIICATDAGREGELIFRLVYQKAGCRKPVRRLWISSLEEEAIRDGFRSMKPMAAYDNLYAAALCRAQADWLIGMNATRHYSLLYGPPLHIGRVMSPTLAMLAQREAAIDDFEPETFYTVKLDLGHGVIAHSERMKDLIQARTLMDACNQDSAVIKRVEHKQRTENPPLLYDLTTLQRDANRYLGYTAQQTLEYAQSLYEKRLLTYPRTDSRYLTHDIEPKLGELASRVAAALPFAAGLEIAGQTGRVINDQKVSDHHAMIPTAFMPTSGGEISALIQDIRQTYDPGMEYRLIQKYNSYVMGVHNYYSIATHVNIDFHKIAFDVKKSLYNRLKHRLQKKGQITNRYIKEKYGTSREVRYLNGHAIVPIAYVQHRVPMDKKSRVNKYTPEGRVEIHKNLAGINMAVLYHLMNNPCGKQSVEYNDNRIALYVAQKGKCAVSGVELEAKQVDCHHKKPLVLGGNDSYQNLIIVSAVVHILIHSSNERTIRKYLKVLNLDKKQLPKLNKLRVMAEMQELVF